LVPNPSFEDKTKCSDQYADWLDAPEFWNSGSYSREYCSYAEHYNSCGLANWKGMPQNYLGFQYPHTGSSYVGLQLYPEYRSDFIQVKLCDTLKAGFKYHVAFYVSLANKSNYAINSIGAYLSKKKIKILRDPGSVKDYEELSFCKPQITSDFNKIYDDTLNWMEISGEYMAKGGEIYIIIGNFNSDKQTQKELVNSKKKVKDDDLIAYYFIDDVCVSEIKNNNFDCNCNNNNSCKCNLPPEKKIKFEVGKQIILNNILFETGKAVLLPKSYEELDSLVLYLKKNLKLHIEISGYTDNIGAEAYNQLLSENRAKAVSNYLILKGIDKSRVSYKGFGSINPIASNESNEGRTKNRRVEIKFLKINN